MPETAIVNSSALIALDSIGMLEFLCKIYEKIIIPEGVLNEFGKLELKCSQVVKVTNPLVTVLYDELNLGKGESEVIALAISTGDVAVLDDQRARNIAKRLEAKITGTIGILLKLEKNKIINSAYEKVLMLNQKGFYVSDALFNELKERWGRRSPL